METGHHIPCETGAQNEMIAEMLESFAVGGWMADFADMDRALTQKCPLQGLFAQMKKDRLVNIGLLLRKEARGMPIWDADEAKKGTRKWLGKTALKSMKKDALIAYLATVYRRALFFLLIRLGFVEIIHLIQIANQDHAALIGIVPEKAEPSECEGDRINLAQKYVDLICDDLLIPKRLCKNEKVQYYGLFMPDEVRAFLRKNNRELIIERMLLDILDCYARATVNLYGVVTMDAFPKVIGKYEARIAKGTMPRGAATELDALIADAKKGGRLTNLRDLMDRRREIARMLIEMSAGELMGQVRMAIDEYANYDLFPLKLDGQKTAILVGSELTDRAENDEAFSDMVNDLLDDQKGKMRYFPSTYDRFMGYAQDIINDDVPAAPHLARLAAWFAEKHGEEIAGMIRREKNSPSHTALLKQNEDNDAENIGQAANEIVSALYNEIVCGTRNLFKCDMGLKMLETRYDLIMHDVAEVNEYLALWNAVNSNSRLFSNNGNTPFELRKRTPIHEGPTKLIFGPGIQGTKIPFELQKAVQSGALGGRFQIDDAAAKRADKKVGRNDPCPCGSGKKYKHCCGKNQ